MKRINVKGIVQGVSFRHYTKKKADDLGISGYVRNLDDGSVEIVAKGDRLEEFLEWCRTGPKSARVDDIEVEDHDTDTEGFQIKY